MNLLFGRNKPGFDRVLLIVTLLLICLGVVIISSASIMESGMKFDDDMYQTKKHLFSIAMAVFAGFICASIPSRIWAKCSLPSFVTVLVLLVLVLLVGRRINGATRWLSLGFMNLQPSELLKLVWILYFSSYITRKIKFISFTFKGFFKPFLFIGVMTGLLMLQPDMGSSVAVVFITIAMLYSAGAGLLKFIIVIGFAVVVGVLAVVFSPYRMKRYTSFLDPWEDVFGDGYQLTQSLMAYGRGGLTGEGLGNSYQKLGYLPEAHTDFVTAIFGEEFGFIGMCCLVTLEFLIVCKAFLLSIRILKVNAIYQGYIAAGIGSWFCFQTFVNIGAASGGLPTKGLTLPLVSYGGSSMIVTVCAIAILLRIDYEWRNHLISIDAPVEDQAASTKEV